MSTARYHAIVLAPESAARQFAAESDWALDEAASADAPDGAVVVRLDRSLTGGHQLSRTGFRLGEELSHQGLRPVGMVANLIGSGDGLDAAGKIWAQVWPQGHGPDGGPIEVTIPDPAPEGNGKKESPPSTDPAKKAAAPATAEKSDDSGKDTSGAADCCEAETLKAALGALADPGAIWAWAEDGKRGELARTLLPDLYDNRAALSERAAWLVSPETVLLDRLCEDKRGGLAEELLRARSKLTEADTRMRGSRADLLAKKVELEAKEVELAGKRVDLAENGVALAGEALAHMQKWRSIADWGLAFLVATTVFSMAAAAYVLLKLMPGKEVSDAAAPIIIFVLALFAISPAVLLLRERPLEGLDKWSPGGGSSESQPKEKDKKDDAKSSKGKT